VANGQQACRCHAAPNTPIADPGDRFPISRTVKSAERCNATRSYDDSYLCRAIGITLSAAPKPAASLIGSVVSK
jgi:hypothetical protein